ncbi:MAG TPA: DegT/DnrJ/EryC1/StrS family aminotransferase [Edaphocola sp.]|nr:DegT/DnrJ/EryC1/StrS family aminotransferase [Edaphocola sp.]
MIPVTKPFLPPMEEYTKFLRRVWESQWLTNMGPMANELEEKLKEYLHVSNLLFVTNGTIALQLAIKALDLKDEIITTPFSFVATTSSIVWEGCQPVFVDIDKDTLNIDPSKIEAAITQKTSAILATHVYGNPCDVDAIQQIADRYNLKVIYDGAHAFGVTINGKSVFEFGDISICSLHATKLYHSVEGGFIVTKSEEDSKKIASMRNFGFAGPVAFDELGINGKNSEFHAAMGLVNLKYLAAINEKRRQLTERYDEHLLNMNIFAPAWHQQATKNYAYYPIVLGSEATVELCMKKLAEHEIFARRYFYPSLARTLPYVEEKSMLITEDISKRVLCLPLYCDLSLEAVDTICKIILCAIEFESEF